MHIKRLIILSIVLIMIPTIGSSNEYRGEIGGEGGEHCLGQSTWRYENGSFIVYSGENGKLYYMLFSNLGWGKYKAFDYAPNSSNLNGSFEINLDNKNISYPFDNEKLLLVFISESKNICHDYIKISSNEWKEFMQQYANSIRNEDFKVIMKHFKIKTNNCR